MINKKLNLYKNLIILLFVTAGLTLSLEAVSIFFLAKEIKIVNGEILAIIISFCTLSLVTSMALLGRLFEKRRALFKRKAWISTAFDYEADIYDTEAFSHTVTKEYRLTSKEEQRFFGAITIRGFEGVAISSFGLSAIHTVNAVFCKCVEEEIGSKKNWHYGLNHQNEYIIYGQGLTKEEFEEFLRSLCQKISERFISYPSLPTILLHIGISIPTPNSGVYENIERALTASRQYSAYRLSGSLIVYDEKMIEQRERSKEIDIEIENALENRQFVIFYQPKRDVKNNRYYGAEALIRWEHPRKGLISPAMFIPQAEASGKIVDIDRYVFRSVCHDIASIPEIKKQGIVVSVNLSYRTVIRDQEFLKLLKEAVAEFKVDPKYIEVELTESLAAQNPAKIGDFTKKLRQAGFRTSMDDFGVGYSSLSALKNIPFDVVKLDKSFIDTIEVDEVSRSMVGSIISLIHGLNISVVAEGVENEEQVKILKKQKVDAIQGFYFSRPIDRAHFELLLKDNEDKKPKEGKRNDSLARSKR